MTTAHTGDEPLSPEPEAIAAAAHDRLQAQVGQDLSAQEAAQRRVAEAASAAIAAGEALSVLADAERTGERRARRALSTDVLRHVARAAKRTREADSEYEQAILLVLGGSGSHTARSPLPLGLAWDRPRDPHPHQRRHPNSAGRARCHPTSEPRHRQSTSVLTPVTGAGQLTANRLTDDRSRWRTTVEIE